ncbi:MAG: 50S ribosomal protein L10 [Deltaproteobacteria bacterium]|nr:50S ribosomal protein L10 [Deltaproteobacteria bacterium]
MNRAQKAEQVSAFATYAKEAPFIVLAEYRGTKVSEINQFRRDLEKNGMRYKVIKNTLARRAFADVGVGGMDKSLKGMTGVVFSSPDAIGSAKVLKDLLKPLPTIAVRAGFFDGTAMAADCVGVVSSLPSREDILAQLLATLQEGPRQLVSVIQAPGRDLVQLLKNYEDKLAGE